MYIDFLIQKKNSLNIFFIEKKNIIIFQISKFIIYSINLI